MQVARKLRFPKGSVVVATRGYVDFKWLHVLDSTGAFFVTRAKTNMAFRVNEDFRVEGHEHPNVLSDQDITLTGYSSKKDYSGKLRLVRYLDSTTGKEYAFLTNNFTWKAKTVANIYKERWHIEVFYRQIKQNLKIKSFVATSENAVQIQIWTALTAILLLKFLKEKAKYDWILSNLVTFIRLNLFVKIDLAKWLDQPFYAEKLTARTGQLNIFDG